VWGGKAGTSSLLKKYGERPVFRYPAPKGASDFEELYGIAKSDALIRNACGKAHVFINWSVNNHREREQRVDPDFARGLT
jgi:hypothetical protein